MHRKNALRVAVRKTILGRCRNKTVKEPCDLKEIAIEFLEKNK